MANLGCGSWIAVDGDVLSIFGSTYINYIPGEKGGNSLLYQNLKEPTRVKLKRFVINMHLENNFEKNYGFIWEFFSLQFVLKHAADSV